MNKKFFGKKVVKFGFVAFALALGLAACGDDGSANGPGNNHEDTNISSVESEENLPSCTESGEGFVNFINGTKEGFICKDRKWVHYDMIADVEENLPGCTGSREGLSAYLYEEDRELNCVEGSWDVVGEVASSSSSVILSDSEGSSSSSAKSSSSVASSSSEESSSSVTSSSSVASSSSSSVIPGTDPGSPVYGTLTDSRDNQVYKTVTIGTQTWMAENLNYAYTGVKYNYSSYTSDSTSWCYENKASNCDKYGRLYTWSAVMDSAAQFSVNAGTRCGYGKTCTPNSPHRGICPEGWHVPTDEEYSTLYTYIGGSDTAGSLLKSTSGWNDYNGKSGNGTDKYGFSVLPAGDRRSNGDVSGEGYGAFLWSASENGRDVAWYLYFYYSGDYAYQIYNGKDYGQSLRCLKD
ncbi:major paralogous domain-containing protein [Fibrobacter sp. UWH9]|uniref:fibrobacter succinogenes major paralogous domain-containing protein n=1 Tax=Fibrobacter sp. UWH9 TaxID=1896213 RepID=UPI0009230D51|nr:fibrobacter succinogenes major paralogous domain-containing protein [Fibrobacter sp. UWH9]SHG45674.1 major paralogous domain-containing protein [Fibrobacter sp. UWH9]